ncbi:MAG: hypothetical protein KAI53_00745 [Candidatus Aenigmarchaeota archaeon]|nr:hypothetical protein [Candidatus Aenigmarchaeota archaeon]
MSVTWFFLQYIKSSPPIVLVGIEMQGTMAAVHALIMHFSRIEAGNMFGKGVSAKIVQAIENKGLVVDVRFLE